VQRIVHERGRASAVEHESGRIEAGAVVLAAGAWSALVEGSGLPRGAVRPVRGQIALLDTRPPLLSRVVFSDKGYVVPRADGRVLCGSTMEEVGFEKAVTAAGLASVLGLAMEIAPALGRASLLETWSNFRPASPDGWPVLGPSSVPGLFYATGHTRNGILLTPITADAVAAAVLVKEEDWSYTLPKFEEPPSTVAVSLDGTCLLRCEEGWRETMVGTISFYDRRGERQHTISLGATPEYGKATVLDRLEREIERVKKGRAVVIPASDATVGHGTHTRAAVWKEYLEKFLNETEG
jgi:hypothetical protein